MNIPWDNQRLDKEQTERDQKAIEYALARGWKREDLTHEALRKRVQDEKALLEKAEGQSVLLGEWPHGTKGRDRLRINQDMIHGVLLVDIRIWEKGSRDFYPTKKGVKFGAGRVDEIIEALQSISSGDEREYLRWLKENGL